MDPTKLKALLDEVAAGKVSSDDAAKQLKTLPYEDLGFAKIDHHRQIRRGIPETIFAAGKTPEQVSAIFKTMRDHGSNVLATRCNEAVVKQVMADHPDADYNVMARTIALTQVQPEVCNGVVAVVCAGTSDIPVAEEAAVTLEALGNKVERITDIGVAGIHRLLNQREALQAATVLIVCAGMEGALPTAIAGLVDKPVIAVPTSVGYGASYGGIAALLGMLSSCAEGVSVVNIDNGFGAAITASQINRLANGDVS